MVTTKVTNDCIVFVEIKEGNAGVYSNVGKVEPKESLYLTVSEQATYREYWCVKDKGEEVFLTSDDCVEWEDVKIYMNETGKLAWVGTKERTSVRLPNDEKLNGYLGRVVNFVKKVHS